jgi:hypothetical protein
VRSLAFVLGAAFVVAAVACSSAEEPAASKDISPTDTKGSSGSTGSSGAPATSSGNPSSSGSTSSGSNPSSGGSPDAAADGPAENCVPKGYAGNEKKIGMYCDENVSCPFQLEPFLVCTHGHDPTGTHLFCTAPCSKDSECGTGAYCMKDPAGSGCVPTQCGGAPGG